MYHSLLLFPPQSEAVSVTISSDSIPVYSTSASPFALPPSEAGSNRSEEEEDELQKIYRSWPSSEERELFFDLWEQVELSYTLRGRRFRFRQLTIDGVPHPFLIIVTALTTTTIDLELVVASFEKYEKYCDEHNIFKPSAECTDCLTPYLDGSYERPDLDTLTEDPEQREPYEYCIPLEIIKIAYAREFKDHQDSQNGSSSANTDSAGELEVQ